ncbi:hypothetical protein PFHG_05297 [Plasmodium falciparum HB3]|uniref:Phosphatidic acid phosphatase type 2/haloperoxidase domain-containing protein n=1 Tax=Plasmodium falciparum (isolate HB3) TaxID=137071 RepID=A0A0L7KLC2_PLAFX|nr:hypothetical protein PFHG_05297 [Plasmodium falciparum HB3]
MPTQTLISDLFLKRIFKKPRPINSALPTYGMPSSHSSFAIALLTFLLLHITEQKKDKWSIITYVIATLTLLPIPWSRVEVEDHTVLQVIVGSLVGIGFGFIFYFMKKIHNYNENNKKFQKYNPQNYLHRGKLGMKSTLFYIILQARYP